MTYETFAPTANGCKLQRGYEIAPEFQVEVDERELGNRTAVAVAEKPRRLLRGYRLRAATREAYEYVASFFSRHRGSAGIFYLAWPEYVPSPDAAPTLEAVSGGTQAERTITVRIAWKSSAGITRASPIGSLLVPASNLIKVTVPTYPPNISQCVIYASQTGSGTEQEQTVLSGQLTWTQPDSSLLVATAAPQVTNTCTEIPLMRAAQEPPFRVIRQEGTTYEVTLDLEEVYHA